MLLVSKAFRFRVKAVNMSRGNGNNFWWWNNFDFQLYWIMYFSRLLKIRRVLEVHNTRRPSYVNDRIPATPGNHSAPSEVTSISEKFTPCPLLTPRPALQLTTLINPTKARSSLNHTFTTVLPLRFIYFFIPLFNLPEKPLFLGNKVVSCVIFV